VRLDIIILIIIIGLVLTIDFLFKKKKKTTQSESQIIPYTKRGEKRILKIIVKYSILSSISIFIFLLVITIQSLTDLPLGNKYYLNVKNNCGVSVFKCDNYSIVFDGKYFENLDGYQVVSKLPDYRIKLLNDGNRVLSSGLNEKEIKSLIDYNAQEVTLVYTFLAKSKYSKYLYETIGDGFWSKEIKFKYVPQNKSYPLIGNIKGKNICLNSDYNSGNYIEDDRFHYTISRNKLLSGFDNKWGCFKTIGGKEYFDISVDIYSDKKPRSFISFYYESDTDVSFKKRLNENYIKYENKQSTLKIKNGYRLSYKSKPANTVSNYNNKINVFLVTVLKNDFAKEKFYLQRLGTVKYDSKGPEILTGYFFGSKTEERVEVEEKNWYGNRHPFVIRKYGDVRKLFVNGKSIKLNPNKNFEEIYKVLYFSVGLGYYRIPIVAYDKYGNKSTSYIKGESVRTD
jgi:hypothetical protein